MRKTIFRIAVLVFAICLLTGCGKKDGKSAASVEQLFEPGRVIGVGTGTGDDAVVREEFPDANIRYFNDGYSGLAALASGKLDAFVEEKLQIELAIRNGQTGVMLMDDTVGESIRVAVGLSPAAAIPDLETKINAFLDDLRSDGTLDDMYDRWVVRHDESMPEIAVPEHAAARLRVGTTGTSHRFSRQPWETSQLPSSGRVAAQRRS